MKCLAACPAPAKLNVFLHVTGRRADGYHLLQSLFRLIDLADSLDFEVRAGGGVRRVNSVPGLASEDDLVVRAARLLQAETGCRLGADITLDKRLPLGAGLGGGSSDAATTLIALNRLWGTGVARERLAAIGLNLGADVPFFIHGSDALVEGIGEVLTPVSLPTAHFVVLWPGVCVPTGAIFAAPDLTRNSEPIRIADFASRATRNDLQAVACRLYPEVAAAIEWLGQHAPARMTGSGACVFAQVDSATAAADIVAACPQGWRAWHARSLSRHPLHGWLD
ncbi:4-(cytidine 5'-diphospho)-2-C-methyl-D-erythritol kinase [Pseudazoarcus pumilus]|uniref:4-(cytidine 5'-diphospho)-2-C-methyl-D-erythritol kinase n=1 Tax=Pseudazoarcus pumilus TaxID=2067960 RepID=UPI001D171FD3|nr:4-(cytidine 5'-diphospho)-2-C-methyl-D-erythritol kinase [Pseudazoarcus pumilus]